MTLVWVAGSYAVVVLLAWVFQRRLLYVAAGRADSAASEGARGGTYAASDGTPVHTLEIDGPLRAPTIVYFHGNGEVIGDDLPMAQALSRRGFSVVLVEYRGYGRSAPGTPTELGLYADADAVLRGLEARGVGAHRVILWGSSLGTGIASEMAVRGHGSALVLVSPYTSMPEVASFHIPWLPVKFLLRDRFDTLGKASRVRVPTVVVHGTEDEVVPFFMGRALADAIDGARFVGVAGGHHNDLFAGPGGRTLDEVTSLLIR